MKFPSKVHHAVAALFDLAYHCAGRAAQAREIAEREGIPMRYLEQILADLRRAGLVDARRGPRGGYALVRPPEAITIGQAVRAIDDVDDVSAAIAAGATSPAAVALGDVTKQIEAVFESVTIADVVRRAEQLGVARGQVQPQMYFI
jgi:Rrf2 family protein